MSRIAKLITTVLSGRLPTKTIGQVTTGLTWWGKNDPNYLYTDAGVTKVSSIGDAVYRLAPLYGALNFDQSDAALRPTYQAAGVYFNDTDGMPLTGTNASLYANNAKTVIFAVQVNTGWVTNDIVIGDSSGYFAIKLVTGNLIQILNYDGTTDVASVAFVDNTPFVVAAWHTASGASTGTISIAINNGTPVQQTGAGNTTSMASVPSLAARSTNYTPMYFKEGATWNVMLAQADREQIVRGLMQSYGIS